MKAVAPETPIDGSICATLPISASGLPPFAAGAKYLTASRG